MQSSILAPTVRRGVAGTRGADRSCGSARMAIPSPASGCLIARLDGCYPSRTRHRSCHGRVRGGSLIGRDSTTHRSRASLRAPSARSSCYPDADPLGRRGAAVSGAGAKSFSGLYRRDELEKIVLYGVELALDAARAAVPVWTARPREKGLQILADDAVQDRPLWFMAAATTERLSRGSTRFSPPTMANCVGSATPGRDASRPAWAESMLEPRMGRDAARVVTSVTQPERIRAPKSSAASAVPAPQNRSRRSACGTEKPSPPGDWPHLRDVIQVGWIDDNRFRL